MGRFVAIVFSLCFDGNYFTRKIREGKFARRHNILKGHLMYVFFENFLYLNRFMWPTCLAGFLYNSVWVESKTKEHS